MKNIHCHKTVTSTDPAALEFLALMSSPNLHKAGTAFKIHFKSFGTGFLNTKVKIQTVIPLMLLEWNLNRAEWEIMNVL